MRKLFLFVIVTTLLSAQMLVKAAPAPDLVINEILPDPVGTDTKLEWIELKNFSTNKIDLSAYAINDLRLPAGTVNPGEIALLVRDKTEFANNFPFAGQTFVFNFSLGNSGGSVKLTDFQSKLLKQQFDYLQTTEGDSFELLSGSCGLITLNPKGTTVGSENTPCSSQKEIPVIPLVLISRVMANPDQGNEWVELTNPGSSAVSVTGWQLTDSKTTFILPQNTIAPGSSITIYPDGVTLNNDGDTLILKDNNGNQVDILSYGTSGKGEIMGIASLTAVNITPAPSETKAAVVCPVLKPASTPDPKLQVPRFYPL
jgi:hypothetical protein